MQLGVETREKEQLKGLLRAAEKAEQKEQISSFTSAVAKWTPTGWFSPAIRKQLGADTCASGDLSLLQKQERPGGCHEHSGLRDSISSRFR